MCAQRCNKYWEKLDMLEKWRRLWIPIRESSLPFVKVSVVSRVGNKFSYA